MNEVSINSNKRKIEIVMSYSTQAFRTVRISKYTKLSPKKNLTIIRIVTLSEVFPFWNLKNFGKIPT